MFRALHIKYGPTLIPHIGIEAQPRQERKREPLHLHPESQGAREMIWLVGAGGMVEPMASDEVDGALNRPLVVQEIATADSEQPGIAPFIGATRVGEGGQLPDGGKVEIHPDLLVFEDFVREQCLDRSSSHGPGGDPHAIVFHHADVVGTTDRQPKVVVPPRVIGCGDEGEEEC